ncbi:MAG: RIP metalloprotease RseP [Steroidobacteraceae bacterium]
MNAIWFFFWFVVAVSLLVTVHEFGHYWVARQLGFKVLRFSVGFGRPLIKRIWGADRTEYVIAALPLGGYVKLLDEREAPVAPGELARSFNRKPPWQRILVLLAGPFFNIAFAILALWLILAVAGTTEVRAVVGAVLPDSIAGKAGLTKDDVIVAINDQEVGGQRDVVFGLLDAVSGDGEIRMRVKRNRTDHDLLLEVADLQLRRTLTEPDQLMRGLGFGFWRPDIPPVAGKVVADGPAARAGLKDGDRIIAVNGERVASFEDLARRINAIPGTSAVLRLERNGSDMSLRVQVGAYEQDGKRIGRILVEPVGSIAYPEEMLFKSRSGPIAALSGACSEAWRLTVMQARLFTRMVLGRVSLKNLSGPLSIAQYAGESAQAGFLTFVNFLVLISLSLGFLNLLPIPILDGGQILFQLAEWIKGSPLSEQVQSIGQQLGIALLLLLMGVAIFNDVARQFG